MSYKACYFMVFGLCFFTVCFISAWFFWQYSSHEEDAESESPVANQGSLMPSRAFKPRSSTRKGSSLVKKDPSTDVTESLFCKTPIKKNNTRDMSEEEELVNIMVEQGIGSS